MDHDEIRKMTKEMEELLESFSEKRGNQEKFEEEQIEQMAQEEAEDTNVPLRESRSQKARQAERKEKKAKRQAEYIDGYLRPIDGLWAAFCIPVVIMVIIFAQRGIFPFGEESFLRTDMYHQDRKSVV